MIWLSIKVVSLAAQERQVKVYIDRDIMVAVLSRGYERAVTLSG